MPTCWHCKAESTDELYAQVVHNHSELHGPVDRLKAGRCLVAPDGERLSLELARPDGACVPRRDAARARREQRVTNVFYELGLAHAARKPVVFTAGSLDDVPFDLRHLRVVVYDNRDPFWGEKLKTNLTAYLKAAKNDPAKSVPQPFRTLVGDTDES